jgi:hypothetical protein
MHEVEGVKSFIQHMVGMRIPQRLATLKIVSSGFALIVLLFIFISSIYVFGNND